jgi:hypothetical protein
LLKPFPNRASAFQRTRLSPDPTLAGVVRCHEWRSGGLVPPGPHYPLTDRLRPFALLRRYPQPRWDVTPTATTASLPRCQHWSSADLPLLELAPVPALLVSQVLCCRGCPLDPLAWRTRFGTSQLGCKAMLAPALPYPNRRLRGGPEKPIWSRFIPLPLSHLFREVHVYRVSRVRHYSLTIAASVTLASWEYGSPSPLARVPTKLDSCPPSGAILAASGGLGHVCLTKRDTLRVHCDTA